jgi:hypothetical protein
MLERTILGREKVSTLGREGDPKEKKSFNDKEIDPKERE